MVCDACCTDVPRVVVAYWGARYCPACCVTVARDNDRTGWPDHPGHP